MKKFEFPTKKDVEGLSKYILRRKNKDTKKLQKIALKWTQTAWENKIDYEVNLLGVPIIQNPYDMIAMQELIFNEKPDVIVETGIAHGGSIIYYASLLELLGHGKVIGIDVDIRAHNRKLLDKHPMIKRVTMIEGSSIDPQVISRVKKMIQPGQKVLVLLDSDHRRPHVLAEMNLYQDIATKGSYIVVFDTFMPYLARLKGASADFKKNSAMDAVKLFMKGNKSFLIDTTYNKFYVTSCPQGFLKKIK